MRARRRRGRAPARARAPAPSPLRLRRDRARGNEIVRKAKSLAARAVYHVAMASAPDISVIVRSMDRPALDRALASIAAQDAGDISAEVLVVAACGPSHRPVAGRIGRFEARLVSTGERLARPRAANAGLDAARGRYITFLDDDDELLPDQFACLAGALEADPGADFVHARPIAVADE